jgi:hypothetical protein
MDRLIVLYTRDMQRVVDLDPQYNMHIYAQRDDHPEVIVWGSRIFIRKDPYTYTEASASMAMGY